MLDRSTIYFQATPRRVKAELMRNTSTRFDRSLKNVGDGERHGRGLHELAVIQSKYGESCSGDPAFGQQ